jgi:hypothetical protein
MGFLVEIVLLLGRVILAVLFELFAWAALSWLFARIGDLFGGVTDAYRTLFNTLRGRDKPAPAPARDGHRLVTCAACGARVPRRKFCSNCGLRLRRGATPLAQK